MSRRLPGLTRAVAPCVALTVATVLVAWSVVRGRAEQRANRAIFLGAAPLVGRDPTDGWVWRFGWGEVAAAVIAATVIAAASTGWWWRAQARSLVVATGVATAAFALALALTDGSDGLRYGVEHKTEYLAGLADKPPAARFVREFLNHIDQYSVHVRGHPPGFVLLLKLLHGLGLGGVWPVVTLIVASTGMTAALVMVTVRTMADDEWMRRVAPVLVVAPYAVWSVSSADAVFTALGAVGVWAVAAGVRQPTWRALRSGTIAGLALGLLLYMTYLGAAFLVLPAAIFLAAMVKRRPGVVPVAVSAVVGAVFVVGLFRLAGFWWFDGLTDVKRQYAIGTAKFRKWGYFGWSNLAVAAIALGPMSVVGLTKLRDRRVWVVVAGAAAALLASHLSKYTKAEVERIWLVFYPWLAIAAGGLIARSRRWTTAGVIAVQATTSIVLQAALVTKW